jgi:hypothetical protein
MTETPSNNQARPPDAVKHAETAYSSNDVRLVWWHWLIVVAIVAIALPAVPWAWKAREPLPDGADRRVPYDLSNDYWLFARYCRQALTDEARTLVLGDSVVWGHYVRDDQTLSHDLSVLAARQGSPKSAERFANLGVDGIHPAAMEGLLNHYADGIRGRNVVLHCNLLWMSSDRPDLTTRKEFSFNHETLVPQFNPWIRCYRATVAERLATAVRRDLPYEAFAQHLRQAYYAHQDLPAWTLARPDDCPVRALAARLPSGSPPASPPADCVSWRRRGMEPLSSQWAALNELLQWPWLRCTLDRLRAAWRQRSIEPFSPQWVELDKSLQWSCFRRTLERLREAGNRVFVLVGPFNEHMLDADSRSVYRQRLAAVSAYLTGAGVPYYVPQPLDSDLYADASHPLPAGYAELARRLYESESFARFDGRSPAATKPDAQTRGRGDPVTTSPRSGETK